MLGLRVSVIRDLLRRLGTDLLQIGWSYGQFVQNRSCGRPYRTHFTTPVREVLYCCQSLAYLAYRCLFLYWNSENMLLFLRKSRVRTLGNPGNCSWRYLRYVGGNLGRERDRGFGPARSAAHCIHAPDSPEHSGELGWSRLHLASFNGWISFT